MTIFATRQHLVTSMADELRRIGDEANEKDAIRLLMVSPKLFRLGDIAMLADEALQEVRRRRAAAKAGQA